MSLTQSECQEYNSIAEKFVAEAKGCNLILHKTNTLPQVLDNKVAYCYAVAGKYELDKLNACVTRCLPANSEIIMEGKFLSVRIPYHYNKGSWMQWIQQVLVMSTVCLLMTLLIQYLPMLLLLLKEAMQ